MNPCCSDTIASLRTTAQVAAEFGVHRTYIWQLARKHALGLNVAEMRMFAPGDVEALRGMIRQSKPPAPTA